jgi:hypothetical protein
MKLNLKAFALTCGLMFGIGFMLATWYLVFRNSPGDIMIKFSQFFFGYSYSFVGGLIGLFWGFIYGAVLGGIFAWLYNLLTGSKSS